jgi:class 3 adenylate cyclase/tetratricopeptide (TPR) repeat protein
MPKQCPACGEPNLFDANFCSKCGQKFSETTVANVETAIGSASHRTQVDLPVGLLNLSVDGERRHVTVLRSDLSGYSAMFEELDPEQVEEIVQPIMDIATGAIARRGGLITEFRGDEIIALFGVAVGENAARDAVQAALDLHDRVRQFSRPAVTKLGRKLTMHTGICTGLVVVRPGSNRKGLLSISGDPVNMAARLVSIAVTNEVLVSPETRRWIEPFFKLEQLEPIVVKGKSSPVTPYRVVSTRSEGSQFEGWMLRGAGCFAGRTSELAQLRQCLARACDGHGQVVAISAEAGGGKSRLVYEFLRGVPRGDATMSVGRCAKASVNAAYYPWIEIAHQLLNIEVGEGAEERLAKVLKSSRELELDTERHVPALCHLLAVSDPKYALSTKVDGLARGQLLWHALFTLLRRSASRRPLIVALEDWQWADRASDNFLRHHLAQLSSIPILVITSFRASPEISWPVLGHLTTVSLEPLQREEIAAMVGSMFELAVVPEWLTLLLEEHTGGNPLFIEETVRSLKEDHAISAEDGELSRLQHINTISIPDTVQNVVLRRLDRLSPDWRETLRRAAVIGREFSQLILEELVGSEVDLDGTLAELEELGFVRLLRDKPHSVFSFKHVIIQNVAYETLLLKQRRGLHGQVARAIEQLSGGRPEEYCESLAYHYARDDNLDRAVHYLEQAGDRAARSFALYAARNQFAEALHLLSQCEQTEKLQRRCIEISLKLASVSHFATSEEHVDVMRRALAAAVSLGDPHLIANCRYWLGRMYYGRGDPDDAIVEFETVLANATHLNNDQLLGRTYCVLGRLSLFTAEPARGIGYIDKGIPILRGCADHGEVAYSLSSHACIRAFIGEFAKAEQLFGEALLLARQNKDRTNEALVLQQLSYARCLRGAWAGAIEAGSNCLQIANDSGLPVLAAFCEIFCAYSRWMSGDRERGYQEIVQAIQRYQSTRYQLAASICHGWFAEIAALQGDLTRARMHADLSIGRDKFGDRFGQLPAYRALARIAQQLGQPSEVRELLAKAIELGEARGVTPDLGITHLYAAELLSDPDATARHRDIAGRIFASAEMPWWEARIADETDVNAFRIGDRLWGAPPR